ncbi:MAG TPA: glycerophosphodiester phosphodiesterase family protein [Dermatophilaceae bacterium]|nr:glycerophosphodiester phosphodiesterase family protein [Dermatophilaceae bacterium]
MTTSPVRSGAIPGTRTPVVIAHRGASEDFAEHTLTAYTTALQRGANGVECDVRLTADGHLVCVHDRRANRTSNGTGVISTLELAQLEGLDWASWKHADLGDGVDAPDADPERGRLLTLRRLLEVLVAEERELVTFIETKHPTRYRGKVERRLVALLEEMGLADGPKPGRPEVRVMSFSATALRRMRRLAPAVPLVLLVKAGRPSVAVGAALPKGVGAVALDRRIIRRNPEVVRAYHRRGYEVCVWTVNKPRDVQRCLQLGVDVIITDRPGRVLAQVAEVGTVQE